MEGVLQGLDLLSTARITYVEVRSGLAARRRSRRLSRRKFSAANENLEQRWLELDVVELDADLAVTAGAAAERFALRSHDALQLASALKLQDADVVMVALDGRLRRASRDAGLALAP